MELWDIIKVGQQIGSMLWTAWNLCGDCVTVCPAFGTVSSHVKIVGFSMSRQQKWLHLALFSHDYIAIVCSSEAYCFVGKVGFFMATHTRVCAHTRVHLYTRAFASGWFTLLKRTDLRLHDLSKPASCTVRGVENSLKLLQHSSLFVYPKALAAQFWVQNFLINSNTISFIMVALYAFG